MTTETPRTPTGIGTDTVEHWSTPLDCGHVPTPPTAFYGNGIPTTPGYAVRPDDSRVCYACADADQLARAADPATRVLYAYVTSDGRTVSTWTGGELARVVAHGYSPRAAFGHGLNYWTVRTADGRRWHGSNAGPGMLIRLRPYRVAP